MRDISSDERQEWIERLTEIKNQAPGGANNTILNGLASEANLDGDLHQLVERLTDALDEMVQDQTFTQTQIYYKDLRNFLGLD